MGRTAQHWHCQVLQMALDQNRYTMRLQPPFVCEGLCELNPESCTLRLQSWACRWVR